MITVVKLEDFVVNHLFLPFTPDFIDYVDAEFGSIEFHVQQVSIERELRAKPENIIERLEAMPETKEKVFRRIKKFGGVAWYRYLDMSNPIIRWIKENLKEIKNETDRCR